ncbi:unnamed protein product [Lampetra fluviatilis]
MNGRGDGEGGVSTKHHRRCRDNARGREGGRRVGRAEEAAGGGAAPPPPLSAHARRAQRVPSSHLPANAATPGIARLPARHASLNDLADKDGGAGKGGEEEEAGVRSVQRRLHWQCHSAAPSRCIGTGRGALTDPETAEGPPTPLHLSPIP